MTWTVIIIETIVMTIAITAMILIPLVKNPMWWIHVEAYSIFVSI